MRYIGIPYPDRKSVTLVSLVRQYPLHGEKLDVFSSSLPPPSYLIFLHATLFASNLMFLNSMYVRTIYQLFDTTNA